MKAHLLSVLIVLGSVTGCAIDNDDDEPIHHRLQVELDPGTQSLAVIDQISLPAGQSGDLSFVLHAGLAPQVSSRQGEIQLVRVAVDDFVERYRLKLPANVREFSIQYAGRLHHSLESAQKEQARGFRNTAGLIDRQGSFLSASSVWYPQFEHYPYLTFDLEVMLPSSWKSVSQGRRLSRVETPKSVDRWNIDKPQEEIYLIAGEFTEYTLPIKKADGEQLAQVFLRSADPKLANKYLKATASYLEMYEKLLGPYAYQKFALVENFWETGFGMPSFTLLGSKVIRLAFILNSSYPHEILHNWWGNGVYVDYATGNWSEGLTAYLADHLIKQQQGQAVAYRQQALQKYRDYAARNRDFPIAEFRGRHSSASEAVGYGKTLMMFHMLRNKVGDEVFTKSLRRLYQDYQFKVASFADLEHIFSTEFGSSLRDFFSQWVNHSGAPELALDGAKVSASNNGYLVEFNLQQQQPGKAYQLDIPLAVTLEGQVTAHEQVLTMTRKQQSFRIEVDAQPVRLDIDPEFDLFRKLDMQETPAAFTQLFGASALTVILPRQAEDKLKAAWQGFAQAMSHMGPETVHTVWDDDIESLPDHQAVAVLGWSNRFSKDMQQQLAQQGVQFKTDEIQNGLSNTPIKNHAFAWATRQFPNGTESDAVPRAWITADRPDALPGLGRKLPHYHKYSYLAFEGQEPQNRLKGRWPVSQSPMTVLFKPNTTRARLEKQQALIEPSSSSRFSQQRMRQTINLLTDQSLQGRGFGREGLDKAADAIAKAMSRAGLKPAGDNGSYFQVFTAAGGKDNETARLKNIIGVIPGSHPQLAEQNLVIGAHYDHLGLGWPDVRGDNQGQIHYGADDNASGVAVLLELARVLNQGFKPDRTLVFVAFTAEEAGKLGSKNYIKNMQEYPINKTIGMMNLDTVGRLFNKPLMVLGAESASEWAHIFRGIGFVTGVPSVMVKEALDASDQVSFHQAGVPAVQLFSGPHTDYHRPGDTPDKIDGDGLVKIAEVSQQVIEYLSSRPEPMTNQLSNRSEQNQARRSRKVSLGSIPDFTFQGEGYRLDGVVPGSPAEQAGLKKQDIILRINEQPIKGLRDVSRVLKLLQPGQTVTIQYQRGDQLHTTTARLIQR